MKWLVRMGPHRFTIEADDLSGARKELEALCPLLNLALRPATYEPLGDEAPRP